MVTATAELVDAAGAERAARERRAAIWRRLYGAGMPATEIHRLLVESWIGSGRSVGELEGAGVSVPSIRATVESRRRRPC
jgi:hypothetical protein